MSVVIPWRVKFFCQWMLVNGGFNVCVIIDKPGRHNETGDVDGDVGVVSAQGVGANGHNAIALHSNVTGKTLGCRVHRQRCRLQKITSKGLPESVAASPVDADGWQAEMAMVATINAKLADIAPKREVKN